MICNLLYITIINHQTCTVLKTVILFLLSFSIAAVYAQERKPLSGKVTSDFDDLEGIYVINKNADRSVTTTRGGYFTINAQVTDTLIFSSIQFNAKEVVVTQESFGPTLFFVPLKTMSRELDELVIVNYNHINSESLGLVPKGQKQYTPAERKLATATNYKMNPMGLDPLINGLTGRTAMLKKAYETEKKEDLMQKINYIYTEDVIVAQLKIPLEYVRGFIYFVVENKYVTKAIKEKNETMAKFLMSGLAVKYLSLLNSND